MEDNNRLKIVLAEKKQTNKWLAGQLGVYLTTVSKWCTNTSQLDHRMLTQIANLLEVDISYLLWPTK
ncbi:helix-turn-helix transcriptional regulator [Parabacteroides distasonis]|nr:helix-turn-helix transcriptional regulator [Parabacteroides distasonis]